jgi:hypothetical protein
MGRVYALAILACIVGVYSRDETAPTSNPGARQPAGSIKDGTIGAVGPSTAFVVASGGRALGAGGTNLTNANFLVPSVGVGVFNYAYSVITSWEEAGAVGLTYCTGTAFTYVNPCPPTGAPQVAFLQGCGINMTCLSQAVLFPPGDYTVSVYAAARLNLGVPTVFISLHMQVLQTIGGMEAKVFIQPTVASYVLYTTPIFTLLSATVMKVNFIGAAATLSPADQTIFLSGVSVNNIETCPVPAANPGSTVTRTTPTTWLYTCNVGYFGSPTRVMSNSSVAECTYNGTAATCANVSTGPPHNPT